MTGRAHKGKEQAHKTGQWNERCFHAL
jgi:hypothetical protein